MARVLLYISGLGQDEVHLNGTKPGDRELAPGWSDYRKRVLYGTLMLGHAEERVYAGLGGIHIDFSRAPADRVVIDPAMLPRIASADVTYRPRVGTIRVAWKHEAEETKLALTMPPNVVATVVFPPSRPVLIRESGVAATEAHGVTWLRNDGGSSVFRVESCH